MRPVAQRLRTVAGQRPTASAAVVYAVLALLFLAPALRPGHTLSSTDYLYTQVPWSAAAPPGFRVPSNTELYDPAFQFIPWLEYTREQLPGGSLLWNPYMAAGRPFLANMQSGVLSPFSLPGYLLPFWWSLGVIAALKLFLGSFGTHLLARRLGQSSAGALLAGTVFGFGLYTVVHLMYPLGSVYVLIPWLLLATDELVRRPGIRSAAAMAVMVALVLVGGHPESSFHAVVFAVAFAAFRVFVGPDRRERAPRAAAWLAGAGVLGAALAGAVLVPFTELLALSADYGNRAGLASTLPSSWLRSIALPEYFGTPTDASGGSTQLGTAGLFIARAIYAGVLPLMLGLLGAALALRRRPEEVPEVATRRFLAAVVAVCLGVIFGLPGLFDAVRHVPVLGQANNTRLIIVYLLAVALLAGYGLDDLRRLRPRELTRRLAPALALLVLAVPLVAVLATRPRPGALVRGAKLALGSISSSTDTDVLHARSLFWFALFGLSAATLVLLRSRGRLAATPTVVFAVALVCADLFRAGAGFNPSISQDMASLPTTPAIRYLQQQRPARFAAFDRGMAPNQAMRYRLFDARNYDFPIIKRYDVIWRRYVFPLPYQPGAPQWVLTLTPSALRVLGLLGVRDMLVPTDEAAYARRIGVPRRELGLGLPGLRLAYSGTDGHIYRLTHAQPRAFVVHAQRVVDGGEASMRAVGEPDGPDLGRVAVTEKRLPGLATDGRRSPAPLIARPRGVLLATPGGAGRRHDPPGAGRAERRALPGLEGNGEWALHPDRAGGLPGAGRDGAGRAQPDRDDLRAG